MSKTIKNFPNYTIDESGIVTNIKKNLQLTLYKRKGYLFVTLSNNNETKQCRVHRLVAEAFIPNPNNYDCINHIDENKENNHYSNLEWCNHQYNNTFGTRIERQSKAIEKKVQQLDMFDNVINIYNSVNEAASSNNMLACNISNCLSGKQKTAPRNKYKWRLV